MARNLSRNPSCLNEEREVLASLDCAAAISFSLVEGLGEVRPDSNSFFEEVLIVDIFPTAACLCFRKDTVELQ